MRKNKKFNVLEMYVVSESGLSKVIESLESTEWFEQKVIVSPNSKNELSAYFVNGHITLGQEQNGFIIFLEAPIYDDYPCIIRLKEIKRDLINKLKSLADNFETSMQYAESFYSYSERAEIEEECLEG